jgi:hypothetical protein
MATTAYAVTAARKLRRAVDRDDTEASPAVQEALQNPALNLWLQTWVLPALDELVREVEEEGRR